MFTVTKYPQGTFSWADCSSSDGKAGTQFYAELMGWEVMDIPTAPGMSYSMFMQEGCAVAGLSGMPPGFERAPLWNNYVTVENVEAMVPKIEAGGGSIIEPPVQMGDEGHMLVLRDPGGAELALWQPLNTIGAGLVNTPGALCWNQLYTREPEAVKAFYSALLGWDFQEDETGSFMILNKGRMNGNMITISEEMGDMPSMWLPYFSVADIEAAAERVKALGGAVHMGPFDVGGGIGRFLLFTDPQGAHCFLIQLNAPEPWIE